MKEKPPGGTIMHRILKKGLLLLAVLLLLCTMAAAADHTAGTVEELYTVLLENIKEQNPAFSVTYTGAESDLPQVSREQFVPSLVRHMNANLPNNDGTGPDLYMMNIRNASYQKADNEYHFTMDYLLNPEKLAWVDNRVEEIARELQLDKLSDYQKVKTVYAYVGSNFTYDYTYEKFTDYEGLTTGSMVCQGYALLTYKLLWECGLPCRIVVGISNNENHGWNIVKLGNFWYNIDTTWDAAGEETPMYWNYFLKSEMDFAEHYTDEAFLCDAFLSRHPIAVESYPVPAVEILIDGVLYSGLTIRNGQESQLQAVLSPEANIPVLWTTTDDTVVSVTQDGLISSLTPGSVFITATAQDPDYIPGIFPVTAVDLRSCSPWADGELNSYYLRKFYPAQLCSDYQTAITREEFSLLIHQLVSACTSTGGQYQFPNFNDLSESPYWYSIVYTTCRGIFDGTGETTFSPNAPVTREQAAKVLCSMLDFMEISLPEGDGKTFADMDTVSPWATDFVRRATAAGLLQGCGETFQPQQAITREQAAVTLERLFVQYVEPNLPAEDAA